MLQRLTSIFSRGKQMKFLFLASHGLRTHLSALRWASGRLRKSSGSLTGEQRHLVAQIYGHTRVLTAALNAMLTLGRLEEHEYEPRMRELALLPLLTTAQEEAQNKDVRCVISCDDSLQVQTDRSILLSIVSLLLFLASEAVEEPKEIYITVRPADTGVDVQFAGLWKLPFLSDSTDDPKGSHLLGGTPGLMLSLADALAKVVRGSVTLEELPTDDDDLVHDGTVERGDAPGVEYSILLRVPKRS